MKWSVDLPELMLMGMTALEWYIRRIWMENINHVGAILRTFTECPNIQRNILRFQMQSWDCALLQAYKIFNAYYEYYNYETISQVSVLKYSLVKTQRTFEIAWIII